MCDARLIERNLFSQLARFQKRLSSVHMGQIDARMGHRVLEVERTRAGLAAEAASGQRTGILNANEISSTGGTDAPSSSALDEVRMPSSESQPEKRTSTIEQSSANKDRSLQAQLGDLLPTSRKERDSAMKELRDILDILWNECLSISNTEQDAVHLVQQLGQQGVRGFLPKTF